MDQLKEINREQPSVWDLPGKSFLATLYKVQTEVVDILFPQIESLRWITHENLVWAILSNCCFNDCLDRARVIQYLNGTPKYILIENLLESVAKMLANKVCSSDISIPLSLKEIVYCVEDMTLDFICDWWWSAHFEISFLFCSEDFSTKILVKLNNGDQTFIIYWGRTSFSQISPEELGMKNW